MKNKKLDIVFNPKIHTHEIAFLKWLGTPQVFPYFWTQKYNDMKIQIFFDSVKDMPYVIHCAKRLYFPKIKYFCFCKSMNIWYYKGLYKSLLVENDYHSPHRYFTATFQVEEDDILFDIGAAEAWVTLENIDKIKHAYIFETDPKWIQALNATFEQYRDKVTIVNKYVSNIDSENTIRLDSFFKSESCNIFIKLDVEGAEKAVLSGMKDVIKHNKSKLVVCTYHQNDDAEFFENWFKNNDYETQFSNGYMFFPLPKMKKEKEFGEPSLRKGILRCWKNSDYPNIVDDTNNLYEFEAANKKIYTSRSTPKAPFINVLARICHWVNRKIYW